MKIGSNVVLGANSLVARDIPDNCVAVGNPCKVLYSIEVYHKKREDAQLKEAVDIVRNYYECYGMVPNEAVLYEHFWLFRNNEDMMPEHFAYQNNLMGGSEKMTWANFQNHKPMFDGYEQFLKYAMRDM